MLFKLCLHSINFILKCSHCFSLYYHYYFFLPPSRPFLSLPLAILVFRHICLWDSIIYWRWADCLSGNILIIRISIFPFLLHVFRFHTMRIYCVKGPYDYIGFILITMVSIFSILRSLNLSANFLLPCKVTYLQLLANQALIVLRGILPTAHIMRKSQLLSHSIRYRSLDLNVL